MDSDSKSWSPPLTCTESFKSDLLTIGGQCPILLKKDKEKLVGETSNLMTSAAVSLLCHSVPQLTGQTVRKIL